MHENTRRNFLKSMAAGLASVPAIAGLNNLAEAQAPAGSIRVWATYGDKRFAALEPLAWRSVEHTPGEAVTLNFADHRQEVLGFGGAFTDASCYVFSRLGADARNQLFQELFDPAQMGLGVCRTCIGSSDYSRQVYCYDESDQPDPELTKFSIAYDKDYILPMLRQARKVNPDLFLFSSPWSPPGWMKFNHSMLGGSMREKYYAPYAQYFVKFLQSYADEGVKIDAITVQNEVDTDQDGRMPACLWGQQYEIEFVKFHLGRALRGAGLDTKIWILDHNYNLWGRAICELSDSQVRQYVDGIAFHGYAGEACDMTRVHEAYPETNLYWTEGGPDITAPDYKTDWTKWSATFADILGNYARSITAWNLALDEKGTPNIGSFPCGGVITIDSGSHEITRSGQYWALTHYARLIRPGARICRSDGSLNGLTHVCAENRDGSRVAVLANRGPERSVQLLMDKHSVEVRMPADSVATLAWQHV